MCALLCTGLLIIYLAELHCIYIQLNGSAHYFPLRSTGEEDYMYTRDGYILYLLTTPKTSTIPTGAWCFWLPLAFRAITLRLRIVTIYCVFFLFISSRPRLVLHIATRTAKPAARRETHRAHWISFSMCTEKNVLLLS